MRSRNLILFAALLAAASARVSAQVPTPPATKPTPSPCTVHLAGVETDASGQFAGAEGTVDFRSTVPSSGTAFVTMEVNALQLSASIDFRSLTAVFDVQTTGSRSVADLTEADHNALSKFSRALGNCVTKKPGAAVDALLRAADLWGEWPPELSLSQTFAAVQPLAITMYCNKAKCLIPAPGGGYVLSYTGPCAIWNWHQYSNHDCNQCENNEPPCQQIAQLGNHYSCNGAEWYWNGSQWKCGEPNHWSRPYIVGNCIGRCGPGCFGWRTGYTKDCTNHDTCIRNGHWDWSWWCNDEFVLAADDFLFAPSCY